MSYMGVVGRILTPPPPNSDSLVYTLCTILFPECSGTCSRMEQWSRPEGVGRQKMHSHCPGRKQISVLWNACGDSVNWSQPLAAKSGPWPIARKDTGLSLLCPREWDSPPAWAGKKTLSSRRELQPDLVRPWAENPHQCEIISGCYVKCLSLRSFITHQRNRIQRERI